MVRLNIKNKLKRVRAHKWLSLLLFVALLVAGFFVYQKIALELNRRAFQDARVIIDKIYSDVVKEIGRPDNFRSRNECSKSNFGPYREIISCGVHTDFVYGVEDEREANEIMKRIKILLKQQKAWGKVSSPSTGIGTAPAPGYESVEDTRDFYEMSSGLLCVFKYAYDSPSETYLKLPDGGSAKTFYVTTGCNGSARDMFYSLQS